MIKDITKTADQQPDIGDKCKAAFTLAGSTLTPVLWPFIGDFITQVQLTKSLAIADQFLHLRLGARTQRPKSPIIPLGHAVTSSQTKDTLPNGFRRFFWPRKGTVSNMYFTVRTGFIVIRNSATREQAFGLAVKMSASHTGLPEFDSQLQLPTATSSHADPGGGWDCSSDRAPAVRAETQAAVPAPRFSPSPVTAAAFGT